MWTQRKTDEYVMHSQMEVNNALGEFLLHYFSERIPTAEEIAERMDIPVEQVNEALASVLEEGE